MLYGHEKGDYPPPKFVICHDDQCSSVVPVCPINCGKVMW